MKHWYDAAADALFVRFSDAKIMESEEMRPGVVLDFDQNGKLVGIELLDARKMLPPDALTSLQAAE